MSLVSLSFVTSVICFGLGMGWKELDASDEMIVFIVENKNERLGSGVLWICACVFLFYTVSKCLVFGAQGEARFGAMLLGGCVWIWQSTGSVSVLGMS